PQLRTFQDWYKIGSKYARVAAGGTIYVLLLVVLQRARSQLGSNDTTLSTDVGNLLRWPQGAASKDVKKILPVVETLARCHPLSFGQLFQLSALQEMGISPETPCSNVAASDHFFEGLTYNSFALAPRNHEVWQTLCPLLGYVCIPAASPPLSQREESPLTPLPETPLPEPLSPGSVRVVNLSVPYALDLLDNCRFPAPRDRAENDVWTEQARNGASAAISPANLSLLEHQLSKMYQHGRRTSANTFVRVPLHEVEDVLMLRGENGDLIAGICTSMSQDMRESLASRLSASFESDPLIHRTTSTDPADVTFQTLHFSWYNRHCTQGHTAPQDVPPRMMKRSGGQRTNHWQMLPYPSKDMVENQGIYNNIKCLLDEVFAFVDAKVRAMLPNEYHHLEATASTLPDNNTSAVHPFLGLVINLNVVTNAH
ncbi:uncharacterized protein B0H18DRAFT_848227, partial [Fomitopsis serialis]|uniref:uncharacterized protein n=1 Tax=Fomitopsis serialis TaxID=139415 RepID=UPI002008B6B6